MCGVRSVRGVWGVHADTLCIVFACCCRKVSSIVMVNGKARVMEYQNVKVETPLILYTSE